MSIVTTKAINTPEPTETSPSRTLLVALGLLAVAGIASLSIPLGFSALYGALGLEETTLLTATAGIVATLSLGLLAVVYLRIRHVEIPIRRPSLRGWGWIVGGTVLSLVAAIAFAILEGIFAIEMAPSSGSTLAAGASVFTVALAAVYFVLVIGPIEEFLFRGVVQGRLRQSFGSVAAIGVTSIGFALTHAPNFWLAGAEILSMGVLVALASIAVASVIMGIIYERTANLTIVAVTHGLTNAVLFTLAVVLVA